MLFINLSNDIDFGYVTCYIISLLRKVILLHNTCTLLISNALCSKPKTATSLIWLEFIRCNAYSISSLLCNLKVPNNHTKVYTMQNTPKGKENTAYMTKPLQVI